MAELTEAERAADREARRARIANVEVHVYRTRASDWWAARVRWHEDGQEMQGYTPILYTVPEDAAHEAVLALYDGWLRTSAYSDSTQ